jgi:hypothetical protein
VYEMKTTAFYQDIMTTWAWTSRPKPDIHVMSRKVNGALDAFVF